MLFNMKVVIRGAPKTGKSSLWQRLQGKPLDPEYATTPEIQIAHINWAFKNMEEAVKVEVWDVVDVGRKPEAHDAASSTATPPPGPPPGGVSFGVLDASAVDVYQNAQAVIFMVNPTSAASFDYVAEQLSSEKKAIDDEDGVTLILRGGTPVPDLRLLRDGDEVSFAGPPRPSAVSSPSSIPSIY